MSLPDDCYYNLHKDKVLLDKHSLVCDSVLCIKKKEINDCLKLIFPMNPELVKDWLHSPNDFFDGCIPWDLINQGEIDIVLNYLKAYMAG